MLTQNIKNKHGALVNPSPGNNNISGTGASKLDREQYYKVAGVPNRSNNSPYQQMKSQQNHYLSNSAAEELPPANGTQERLHQQAKFGNSQNEAAAHKLANGSSYGSNPGQNKMQLPQLSRIADRSQNQYLKPKQGSSTKTNKMLAPHMDQSKWNASRFSDNGTSSFQNYSAQDNPSSSSNHRINTYQVENNHQRDISNFIERCIEMAPKRGSAINPFAQRVENSANSTGQSSSSNPPPAIGQLPPARNPLGSKAQSSQSLKSDQQKPEGSQYYEASQNRGGKSGGTSTKNKVDNLRAAAARANHEPSPSFPGRNAVNSGTALREKRDSNQQSQEHIQGQNNQGKNEQEAWDRWRKWQQRLSGRQKGPKGQEPEDKGSSTAFKKKASQDLKGEQQPNYKGANTRNITQGERPNRKLHSINSEDDGKQGPQEKTQRKSRLQPMARNNDSQVNVNADQNQQEVDEARNESSSEEEEDLQQQQYEQQQKLPDPQLEKIQNALAPYLGGPPTVSAQSWAIFDCNEQCLLKGRLETMRREVASITKMMTFYTVICIMDEYKIDPKKTLIAVSRMGSSVSGTTAELKEGDVLSLYQLFYAMMLPSGNDAAFTLGEYFGEFIRTEKYNFKHSDKIFGNIHLSPFYQHPTLKYFLREMNLNAQKLHMFDSYYDSPHGLRNERNFSTAYDVALLTNECMKIPLFRQVVGTGYIETRSLGNQVAMRNFHERKLTQYRWESTNKLLGCLDGLIGCKTGITTAAGPCFAGYYEADGLKLAVILCCSRSMEIRWMEIQRLVAYVKSAAAKYNQMKELQLKQKQRMDHDKSRFTRLRTEGGN